jgi:SAM-dependent methyltransferase
VPDSTLFTDYFYFSSAIGTLRKHFKEYASEIVERFDPQTLVEIGCNDGVLLKPLADLGVPRLIGVDPAENVTRTIDDARIDVVNAYFGPGVLDGKADCVVANNVFAHVSDLNGVTAAVADLLTDDGVFIFEVNRLDGMIADLQYDWVYHEHRYYYSLMALENLLERHGLMVFDLKRIGTHAGSIRYYACREGMVEETPIVEEQRQKEIWHGLDYIGRYYTFAEAAQDHRERLVALVKDAKAKGETVAGYGACGRANTLLQWCGLTNHDIDFIVDDAPAKQGYFTPGSHIPIVSRHALETQPDKLILFAWSFLEEIYAKCADYEGEVIIPLPEIVRTRSHDTRIAA